MNSVNILPPYSIHQLNVDVCALLRLIVLNVVQSLSCYFGIHIMKKMTEEGMEVHYVVDQTMTW